MKSVNKTAIVTGAAKGLGREIAIRLSREGFSVCVHYNKSQKEAETLIAQIENNSFAVSGDLKDERTAKSVVQKAVSKLGRVDLLVNNVGNFLFKEFSKTTNAQFADIIESNVYSTLFTSRAVLEIMRKQKSGNIINIGSVGAERITLREKSTPYFMAKNAVWALTKVMAWEEAKNGVRINMISPASMAEDIFSSSDFPMGRPTKYDDIFKTLLFLISDDAYYINGSNIEVAGGFIPGMN